VEKTLSNISCTINDYPYQVLAGSTILKACEQSGLLIPRFCYHDRLSIAGNCRMCLVQLDKAAKPVASCALEVSLGMKIYTNTSLVKKAREGVMEFLLANHPLDCPICDQGGECDLQDQALIFGNDRGRFYETKRAVVDKDWGHLIKTIMTRCIHCTRCQRFSTELSGRPEVLMVGRGNKSEISNFIMNLVKSEVSGNVIDLCPVGALTSKPYAFTARPWELRKVYSIDLTDSLHSNLVYQIGKQRILRVLPVLNKELNEEWLADRSRYSYDGFRLQRIAQPFAIDQDSMETLEWEVAFLGLLFQVGPFFGLSALLGELSLQSSYLAAKLETFSTNEILDNDQRSTYFLNLKYVDLPRSDLIILVGTDLKRELPLLLMKLRFEQTKRKLQIVQFGVNEFGLEILQGGSNVGDFLNFLEGRHTVSPLFIKAKNPVVLVANRALPVLLPFSTLKSMLLEVRSDVLFGVVPNAGVYHGTAVETGLSLSTPALGKSGFSIFFINTVFYVNEIKKPTTTIYFGSHGFDVLIKPNISVFPVYSLVEEDGVYINFEGRVQVARSAFIPAFGKPVDAILLMLIAEFGSLENAWAVVSDVLELSVYETAYTTFYIPRKSFISVSLVPFPSANSSVYKTTTVTQVSPAMTNSASAERRKRMSSFPEVIEK
jgi:NADH dehydrogenase (ubiquinone) Fe-S protein 1